MGLGLYFFIFLAASHASDCPRRAIDGYLEQWHEPSKVFEPSALTPKLQRLMNTMARRVSSRKEPSAWREIIEVVLKCSSKCHKTLENPAFELRLRVKRTPTELRIRVMKFIAKELENSVQVAERPNGLNPAFSNLVGALALAGAESVARIPGLKRVAIGGEVVVNKHLANVLKELGFQSNRNWTSTAGSKAAFSLAKVPIHLGSLSDPPLFGTSGLPGKAKVLGVVKVAATGGAVGLTINNYVLILPIRGR